MCDFAAAAACVCVYTLTTRYVFGLSILRGKQVGDVISSSAVWHNTG